MQIRNEGENPTSVILSQGRQHDFKNGGAKTQPIFMCYNFCFETLDTWKNSFLHSSIFDHWKFTLNRVSKN